MLPPLSLSGDSHSHVFPTANCNASAEAAYSCQFRSQKWRNWYIADYMYGRTTTYFWVAFLGLCMVSYALVISQRRSPTVAKAMHASKLWQKIIAFGRLCGAVDLCLGRHQLISLSNFLVIALFGVFLAGLAFGPQPYYWPRLGWAHSPPLATRTGWMAIALMVPLFLLAAKRNMITLVTGLSHDRLQIFHQWVAYAFFVLALLHTFPFIYYNAQTGISMSRWKESPLYWTGVVALIFQAQLTFGSLKPLRNYSYELFKFSHRLIALAFFVFLFLHCGNILTSWDYFYITFALYGTSVAWRICSMILVNMRADYRADIELIGSSTLQIRVYTSFATPDGHITWKPGQHVFLRAFVGYHSLFSHPLTIANCAPASGDKSGTLNWELQLSAKVRKGTTARLASMSRNKPLCNIPVWLDGPYGAGINVPRESSVLLLAGGAGATFVSGIASHLAASYESHRGVVQVVMAAKHPDVMAHHLEIIQRAASWKPGSFAIAAHATQAQKEELFGHIKEEEEEAGSQQQAVRWSTMRPDMIAAIRQAARESTAPILTVVACGPDSLLYDVRQGVARLELEILKGRSESRLRQVKLISESYSW